MIAANYRLAAIAVVAASQSVARAIAVAARGAVAATIAEAAFLATRLGLTAESCRAGLPAKTLAATHTRSMALGAVAVCLAVPLTVTFFASGMAMAAVRRAVVESCAASLS